MPRRRKKKTQQSNSDSDSDSSDTDTEITKRNNRTNLTNSEKLLSSLALVSLLGECNKLKKERSKKIIDIDIDSDTDSDYAPEEEEEDSSSSDEEPKKKRRKKQESSEDDNTTSDSDTDTDEETKKKRNKKRNKRKKKKTYKSASKALSKLRGGVLDDDETRYLKSLNLEDTKRVNKTARKITRKVKNSVPLVFRILDWELPERTKSQIIDKINKHDLMEPTDGEYSKLSSWVNGIESLPIGKYKKLPVDLKKDKPDKISKFLENAKTKLDSAVFGHENAKNEIIKLCAQWIRNPKSSTQVLGFHGSPGVGKTQIVKHGLSNILHRPFTFISMGGAHDSSFLSGFEYTFEGARPGRIANAIKNAGCMNPVIFLDELDKLSNTPRGHEIQQTLIHLFDSNQNSHFQDTYFNGIDLDLSRAVFVVSFNDATNIDKILLDRMHLVEMKGFNVEDKLKIATKFLIPEILKIVGITNEDITFTDDAIKKIISVYTQNEKGVRNLKRRLQSIIAEVNLQRLMKKHNENTKITENVVSKYLKHNSNSNISNSMYM
jgi:ATP-dependent Lon protease